MTPQNTINALRSIGEWLCLRTRVGCLRRFIHDESEAVGLNRVYQCGHHFLQVDVSILITFVRQIAFNDVEELTKSPE
jgi:hypothetical protein